MNRRFYGLTLPVYTFDPARLHLFCQNFEQETVSTFSQPFHNHARPREETKAGVVVVAQFPGQEKQGRLGESCASPPTNLSGPGQPRSAPPRQRCLPEPACSQKQLTSDYKAPSFIEKGLYEGRSHRLCCWSASLGREFRSPDGVYNHVHVRHNVLPNYHAGDFSATFAGPALSYYANQFTAPDPCIRNIGPGQLSLVFNQPVLAISFDVGGLDSIWADKITFSIAPGSPLGATLNRTVYFTENILTLSGTSLIPTDEACGARVTFANLGGGAGTTSFVWRDDGTAGILDWVLYDNFSFTVVPEPTRCAFLGLIAAAVGISRYRK